MKRILSLILSQVILFLSIGVTMSTHYCGGKSIETKLAFGKSAVSCGMESEEDNSSSSTYTIKSNCCENVYQQYQIEEEFFDSDKTISSIDFEFITVFKVKYLNLYAFDDAKLVEYFNFLPPLLHKDRSVLFQVFRI